MNETAEVSARFGEIRAYIGGRAVAVVCHGLDDDRRATRAVAFVANLIVALRVGSGCLLDGALYDIARHVLGARRDDRHAQASIHRGVGHPKLGRDCDLARQLGEQLGLHRVLPPLAVHDVLELRMSGHGDAQRKERFGLGYRRGSRSVQSLDSQ
jgi:hypothetical protein